MYLVFCSSSDESALWAYQGLKQAGVESIELVLAETLALGAQWEHRLDRAGAHLKISLPDGRTVCGSRIRGVLNRLHSPSPLSFEYAAAADKEYAQTELQAFYLSWLHGLPGVVINRPTPQGLCGAWSHASEWMLRASRAGLRIKSYRQSAHDAPDQFYRAPMPQGTMTQNVIAFDGEIFGGEVSASVARGCAVLAREANAEILAVEMYLEDDGEWTFAHANTAPDLSLGGSPLLASIARKLVGGNVAISE
jgi:hypothetical protein